MLTYHALCQVPVIFPALTGLRASAHFYDDLVDFAALRPLV